MSKLWIIVPIYRGEEDVPDFCASLIRTTSDDTYTLIAVDDCSPDDSSSYVQKLIPHAILLRNERNRGFAVACNKGMRYAIDHGAKYVMLANQDLRFMDGWMSPLVQLLEKDTMIGAIQPKILMYPDTSLINSCGNELHILGFGYTGGYLKKQNEFSCNSTVDVAYCSGAAVIYRVSALQRIGLLDEELYMYHEDSDVCWRLWIVGYRNVMCPISVLAHRYEFSRSITKFYYIERNRLVIMLKNYQLKTLFLLFPLFILWECGMVCYCILQFFVKHKSIGIKEKFRGYFYFLRSATWKYIARERKKICMLRKKTDREIMEYFTDEILFQDIDNPIIQAFANPITRWYWKLIRNSI